MFGRRTFYEFADIVFPPLAVRIRLVVAKRERIQHGALLFVEVPVADKPSSARELVVDELLEEDFELARRPVRSFFMSWTPHRAWDTLRELLADEIRLVEIVVEHVPDERNRPVAASVAKRLPRKKPAIVRRARIDLLLLRAAANERPDDVRRKLRVARVTFERIENRGFVGNVEQSLVDQLGGHSGMCDRHEIVWEFRRLVVEENAVVSRIRRILLPGDAAVGTVPPCARECDADRRILGVAFAPWNEVALRPCLGVALALRPVHLKAARREVWVVRVAQDCGIDLAVPARDYLPSPCNVLRLFAQRRKISRAKVYARVTTFRRRDAYRHAG